MEEAHCEKGEKRIVIPLLFPENIIGENLNLIRNEITRVVTKGEWF